VYDSDCFFIQNAGTPTSGFNLKKPGSTGIYFLPFGGDTSNNAIGNSLQFGNSTWLRVQPNWTELIAAGLPPDELPVGGLTGYGYVPLYWRPNS
jgi:hypothetical protein